MAADIKKIFNDCENAIGEAMMIGLDASVSRLEIGTQLGMSDASVNACIIALKKKGVLFREGGKRYGKWVLSFDRNDE